MAPPSETILILVINPSLRRSFGGRNAWRTSFQRSRVLPLPLAPGHATLKKQWS